MSCDHYNCDKESKDAKKWFFSVIVIAITFVCFLYKTDEMLTNSDKEQRLGYELGRLRTAQSTLPSRVSDERQMSLTVASESK